jgi:MerR family transcriptional regulator/heat shock protein HspR
MPPQILPREQVARRLAVSPALLVRFEARGLIRAVRVGEVEGYEPSEVRRAWSVVSLHREAGLNLAGVETVLRLRDQLDEAHRQIRRLAEGLRAALEAELEPGPEDPR